MNILLIQFTFLSKFDNIYLVLKGEIIMDIKTNELTNKPPKNSRNRLSRPNMLFTYFLIFAFLGWVLETFYSLYELGHFTKRGFLYGPICPIYGFGALILILFFSKYKKKSIKLFIYASIVFSIFEYVVSYGMDALFAAKWWDYTNEFFNLNGRISIFYSFIWGIAAILFINHIYPFFKRKLNVILSKIPYKFQLSILHFLGMILLIDTFLSFIRYLM